MARGKNFADVFFDVFRRVVHDSALRLPNFSLVAKLSKLSTLSVHDCTTHSHGNSTVASHMMCCTPHLCVCVSSCISSIRTNKITLPHSLMKVMSQSSVFRLEGISGMQPTSTVKSISSSPHWVLLAQAHVHCRSAILTYCCHQILCLKLPEFIYPVISMLKWYQRVAVLPELGLHKDIVVFNAQIVNDVGKSKKSLDVPIWCSYVRIRSSDFGMHFSHRTCV